MEVKVLGTGCKKCQALKKLVRVPAAKEIKDL